MAGLMDWLLGKKEKKKRKKESLGLSYELQKLLELSRSVEDNEPKTTVLGREKRVLKEVIKICDDAEDVKKIKIKDFKFDLKRVEKFFKTIKSHEDKLKKVNSTLEELEDNIRIKKKQISDAKQVVKYNNTIKKETIKDISAGKKKVVSELEEIKKRIKKLLQEASKATKKKLVKTKKKKTRKKRKKKKITKKKTTKKKPKKKKAIRKKSKKSVKRITKKIVEEPVLNISTKVVVPEVEKKEKKKRKKKKKVEGVVKSYSEEAEKIRGDVMDEALSDGEKPKEEKEEKQEEDVGHSENPSDVETEVDQILTLVREKGKISFSKMQRMFDEKGSTIEEWAEALEEQGFVEIIYPLIGSPYIRLKK